MSGLGSRRSPGGATVVAWLLLCALLAVVACVPRPVGRATPQAPPVNATGAPSRATPSPAGPTPSLTFSRPTATPLPTFFVYRVRTGDSLTSIAREFRTTARSIGYWNRDEHATLDPESSAYNPNDIRVGWMLRLIPGVEVDPDEITPPPTGAPPS